MAPNPASPAHFGPDFRPRYFKNTPRGPYGPPEGKKSKKCPIFWGPKVGPKPEPGIFFSKCQECPWDHF